MKKDGEEEEVDVIGDVNVAATQGAKFEEKLQFPTKYSQIQNYWRITNFLTDLKTSYQIPSDSFFNANFNRNGVPFMQLTYPAPHLAHPIALTPAPSSPYYHPTVSIIF